MEQMSRKFIIRPFRGLIYLNLGVEAGLIEECCRNRTKQERCDVAARINENSSWEKTKSRIVDQKNRPEDQKNLVWIYTLKSCENVAGVIEQKRLNKA